LILFEVVPLRLHTLVVIKLDLGDPSHVRSTIDEYIQAGSSMDQAASLG
jgi:hypothetical protein